MHILTHSAVLCAYTQIGKQVCTYSSSFFLQCDESNVPLTGATMKRQTLRVRIWRQTKNSAFIYFHNDFIHFVVYAFMQVWINRIFLCFAVMILSPFRDGLMNKHWFKAKRFWIIFWLIRIIYIHLISFTHFWCTFNTLAIHRTVWDTQWNKEQNSNQFAVCLFLLFCTYFHDDFLLRSNARMHCE